MSKGSLGVEGRTNTHDLSGAMLPEKARNTASVRDREISVAGLEVGCPDVFEKGSAVHSPANLHDGRLEWEPELR